MNTIVLYMNLTFSTQIVIDQTFDQQVNFDHQRAIWFVDVVNLEGIIK